MTYYVDEIDGVFFTDRTAASAEEFDARLDAIEAAQPAPESWHIRQNAVTLIPGQRAVTADEMRAALTAVLAEVPEMDAEFVADRILPAVRGIVAGELRAAADGIGDWPGVGNAIKGQLRDRAAALGPTS